MNANIETAGGALDTAKLALALLIVIAALAGFYFFADYSMLYRVLGLLAAIGVSVAIALRTGKGRQIWGYFHEAQIEVRKVVWPTRQETVQTTLIVIIMVIIVALILWGLDALLGWLIGMLMGHGA